MLILSSIAAMSIVGNAKDIELADLNVTANLSSADTIQKQGKYLGESKVSKDTIESLPSVNRGLTDILRVNPNVQFGNTQITSKNSGEIDPQDISINGAKFYQNNFMIDGLNINNDLNPGKRIQDQTNIPGKTLPDLGSISQGINIDSGLIESITVHDSSVSARYGGFQGGVIDTKTRDPQKGFHGKISTSHTSDKLTKFHIDKFEKDSFKNSFEHINQPKFSKWKHVLELDGSLTDDFGMIFNYSQIRSKIPLVGYWSIFMSDKKDSYEQERVQIRKNENFFLKAKWFATDRLTITPTIIYAPSSGIYYNNTTKDSKQTMNSGGLTTSVDVNYDFDWLNFKQIFGYSKLESSRDAEKEYWIQWLPSDKRPWGKANSYEGGYGDITQEQETFSYDATLDFAPIEFLNIEHNFATGLQFKHSKGIYGISKDFYTVTSIGFLKAGEKCLPNDPWCSMDALHGGRNHYQRIWEKYKKGKATAKIDQISFWLEDEMKIGNLSLRPGLRFDSDNYMNKDTIAPRFSSVYDVFGDKRTQITFGANRYYGRSSFAYALQSSRDTLKERWVRKGRNVGRTGIYSEWEKDPDWNALKGHFFKELKIPYDDEIAIGLNQRFANFDMSVKYVKRNGKDQVVKSLIENEGIKPDGSRYKEKNVTVFTNKGKSKSDTYTLSFKNIMPYEFHGTRHKFELGFSYSDYKTNFSSYELEQTTDRGEMKDISQNPTVKLDGKYIKYSELPSKDYNKPWTLRVATISSFPQINLTWGNIFRLDSGQKYLVEEKGEEYKGELISVYKTKKISNAFNWDTSFGFEWNMPKKSKLFANIDILNVLNRKNVAGSENKFVRSEMSFVDVVTYQTGRQFWFEVGYKW